MVFPTRDSSSSMEPTNLMYKDGGGTFFTHFPSKWAFRAFSRLSIGMCHPDLARTNLSLACAMMSLVQDGINTMPLPPDLPLLSRLFRQMVHDESIDTPPATAVSRVSLPPNVIATCNFCSTAIWNRHVRCTQCADFDLCLLCYVNGRSCDHPQAYAWAEIVPSDQCSQILNRAREILGYQQELHPNSRHKQDIRYSSQRSNACQELSYHQTMSPLPHRSS